MKNLLTLTRTLAVPALLGWWACAGAQSLGTPAAAAWIGQPLEMTVPARFASSDGDECVHADVFYGENRVKANQVRTTVTGLQDNRRVRIEAEAPIDEPIVTVSVRAGCRNTITRNYTLLPELPSESMLAAAARPAFARAGAVGTGLPSLRMDTAVPAPRARVARHTMVAAHDAAPAPAPARKARAFRQELSMGGPRLRMEPIEAGSTALLRVSAALADPGGDAARRATAALLWQAINADPSELLRTSAMLQKLEQDLTQLRQNAGQTRSEMTALRQRIDEARPWYASSALIQLLGLLVLAAAAAAGVLWYRTRHSVAGMVPWYDAGRREPQDSTLEPALVPPPVLADVEPPRPVAERRVAAPAVVPAPVAPAQPRPLAPAMPAPLLAKEAVDVAQHGGPGAIDFVAPDGVLAQPAPRHSGAGALRVETLAATFEEAEFLSSLGLTSDAMDVLKAYLQDSTSPAPIAFFELMRLCDQAEDPTAVATVRRRYTQTFGVEAPRLEQVTAAVGLDAMKELGSRITATWGRPQALELIEEALFTVPRAGAAISLQAGRELVCLYDLALALLAEAGRAPAEDDSHPLAPWAHAPDAAHQVTQELADPNGGDHFALDVDLTAAAEALAEPQDAAFPDLELAPLVEEMQEQARREAAARAAAEEEDAFSAAVASERAPIGRH